MKIPQLHSGSFSILVADQLTGHILNCDGTLFDDKKDYFWIAADEQEIFQIIAENRKTYDNVEWIVYNWKGEFVKIIRE